MKSFAALAAAALFASGVAAQSCTINTPTNVAECIPVQFAWNGGTAPYYLSIEPGSDPSAAALQRFGPLTGTTYSWTPNITANTDIGLTLVDSTGVTCQSASFIINSGSTSCLSASGSSAPSGASSTSGGASSTASSGGSTTSGGSSSASHSGSATSSPSSSATSSKSSAGKVTVSAGIMGVLAAAVAALLA